MKPSYVLAGLVLLLAPLAVPAFGIPITGPTEITAPGTYELTAKVVNSGSTAYIVVKADGVTIDGNGYLLDGKDFSTSKAIAVERYIKNNVWETRYVSRSGTSGFRTGASASRITSARSRSMARRSTRTSRGSSSRPFTKAR